MKIALLGVDSSLLELAAAPPQGIEIVRAADLSPAEQARLEQAAPSIPRTGGWETLLTGEVDAVVVARGQDSTARIAQVRRLAAEGVPLLISHPLSNSSLDLYEIELAQRDGKAALVPWLAARRNILLRRIAKSLPEDEIQGTIDQLIFERALEDRSPEVVWNALARDLDMLRAVCGELNRVLATGPREKSDAKITHFTVHLNGPNCPPVRWSLEPARGDAECRLIFVHSRGESVFHLPDRGAWWNESTDEELGGVGVESAYAVDDAFNNLTAAMTGAAPRPSWTDAVRSVELLEAVERSLRRGRQVELRWDENTEASNFKSTMTALGCGLLVFGLLAIVAAAVGQKVAEKLGFVWLAARLGEWPWWLLAFLIVFLALQGLRVLIGDQAAAASAASNDLSESSSDDED
jgi:hypothetical protein